MGDSRFPDGGRGNDRTDRPAADRSATTDGSDAARHPAASDRPAERSGVNAVWRETLTLLGSTRLFILLALFTIAFAAATTLVPTAIPTTLATPVFLVCGTLLELNLLACTIPRFMRRLRLDLRRRREPGSGSTAPGSRPPGTPSTPRRLGPLLGYAADVIHLGLAVLIAAGMASFALNQEAEFSVQVGEARSFRGLEFTVAAAEEEMTDDGVVTGWRVRLEAAGSSHSVALNRPARIEGSRFYLQDFAERGYVLLSDGEARQYVLRRGEGFEGTDGRAYYLTGITDSGAATFAVAPSVQSDPTESSQRMVVDPGGGVASFTYIGAERQVVVGLRAAHTPARVPILVGLMLMGIGMAMYLLRIWRRHG